MAEKQPGSSAGDSPTSLSRRQLLAALTATDRLTSSAAGQERLFAALSYSSHALHHLLASAPWLVLQTRLGLLARLRQSQSQSPAEKPAAPSPGTTSPLLALSALFSETRYTLRLLGLIPLWTWGVDTLKNPPADRTIHVLTVLQVLANVVYQSLENGGYLAAKGVVSKRWVDRWGGIDKWYLWSVRAWLGHIVLQFGVLWRQYVLRKRRESAIAGTMSAEKKEEVLRGEIRAWKKSLVNNVFWAPLALHWSVEKGVGVPGSVTGFGSFMAGAWGFLDLWRSTA